ncbi:ThiJ/PfpI domain protein [Alkaliphilus metalliredigens QYMF]|uniref:ThiJ/PfpI domain protein n=1 Tax=Alkaliphilus metalliredigens (strain QYMF) TaxID=293826 RepID=A6TNA4_ALKMQ|nr:DJ-1/PfpI family protein [Alkaliphilus metalliredigens]ABR47672.1 ThiJ/PfpI domain protein [Alkaliphilus metalliredigens QYMF]
MKKINVGIFIFDQMETLDFAGPFEVFSVTGQRSGDGIFQVFTIAAQSGPVLAVNGLSINPHYVMEDCPEIEILIIPGGVGAREVLNQKPLLDWVKNTSVEAELVLSVCTGALILAQCGLLKGLKATTHHQCLELLKELEPTLTVTGTERFVDNGKILTAAGISAGIDMSLYVVERLLGREQAEETAHYMEYPY